MRTKRTWLSATALILTAMLGAPFAAAQHPRPPRKERKIVRIRGNQAWLNTGIRLNPRDRVTIQAAGKICFSNGEKASCVDADGWGVQSYPTSWPYNWNYCDDPMTDVNHAALIANVGHPDFLVGRHLTFSGKDGTLYLGINDCTFTGKYSNTGELSVVIVVERNAVPQP
jgi:outer membrane protease